MSADLQAIEVALRIAFSRARGERQAPVAIGKADRGEAKAALLDGDATGLFEQRVGIVGAHDERVDRRERRERAVHALDAPLLRFERRRLLEQLVDHQAQMVAIEIGGARRRRSGPCRQHLLHRPQDHFVVRRLDQHPRHAQGGGELFRILPAEVRRVENHAYPAGGGFELQAPRQLIAVHAGHEHIGDDEHRGMAAGKFERPVAVVGRQHLVPEGLQEGRECLAIGAVIVRNEDFHFVGPPAAVAPLVPIGMETSTFVP